MGWNRTAFRAFGVALALALASPLATSRASAETAIEPLYVPAMVVSEANFRADPSTSQPPLDTFQAGKQVLILGVAQDSRGRDWFAVSVYDDAREGFIFGTLLRPLPDFPEPPKGLGVTKVGDSTERDRLVGRHDFYLNWITGTGPGELVAFEDLGLIYIRGRQKGAPGEELSLNGYVTEVGTDSFTMTGTLVYSVPSLTGNGECRQRGKHSFVRSGGQNPWRLATVQSPCGQWEQYLDIQLRKE